MLQFITHHTPRFDEEQATLQVLEGGCRWIQLRMKDASEEELLRTGRRIGALCRQYGATFIIDDHVELVKELGADGVHLGKNDMPVAQARKMLGQGCIIGATANTFEDVARAVADGADYLGIGPFRYTTTKKNLSPILGTEGYIDIMRRCRENGIDIPTVAIGGITADDIAPLLSTGVTGIALSGALLNAPDPQAETNKIVTRINNFKK